MWLPIDARRAPFKAKYLDSETLVTNRWCVLGEDRKDGTVFVTDGTDDIFCGLTPQQADALIRARETFCVAIANIINKE